MNNFESYGGMTPQKEQEILAEKERETLAEKKYEGLVARGKEKAFEGLQQLEAMILIKMATPTQINNYPKLVEEYKEKYDPNYESSIKSKEEAQEIVDRNIIREEDQKLAA